MRSGMAQWEKFKFDFKFVFIINTFIIMSRSITLLLQREIYNLKVKHHEELEEAKELLLKEKEKVKYLEDRFGVTEKRRWETRKSLWWMIWLYNNDSDAYEYLLKTIHKGLLCQKGSSLETMLNISKNELNSQKNKTLYYDEYVNLYGMKLKSSIKSWIQKEPIGLYLPVFCSESVVRPCQKFIGPLTEAESQAGGGQPDEEDTHIGEGDAVVASEFFWQRDARNGRYLVRFRCRSEKKRQTKDYLINCCILNKIDYKKSYSKMRLLKIIFHHTKKDKQGN